jgi:AbrB family looped-hinge helix DNA binding protein
MAKVTSKLQVTVPKALAERYGIAPGSEIEWQAAGEVIRVIPPRVAPRRLDVKERLRLFDDAMDRQREREARRPRKKKPPRDRGWTRESLYERGRTR